ncbi:hypothetical protein TNCV_266251 [Trichonephila clavipes]|nr:hypothetical protein TNCV_266251 [Trichonephila clavipes]
MSNPNEKDKTHLESKLDVLKSLLIKLSDIRNEYYEVERERVADDSDLEPLESEILDLEDDCEDIQIRLTVQFVNNNLILYLDAKKFNDASVNERFNSVKRNNLCINCFSSSHKVALCKSSRNCPNCSKRHNSLLCRNFERNVDSQRSSGSETLPNMEPRNTLV